MHCYRIIVFLHAKIILLFMSDKKQAFWFIVILSVLVIIPFLGETIFYSKGEPREAIVGYAILESGNWILPLNYGMDIAYKPPFLYWLIAAFSTLFGGVTEFSSRFPSAISFLAMQFVVFTFFAKRKNVETAFLTSILLLTSFEVHRAAVACRLDMLQVSLIVISLCLLYRWDERHCRNFPWLAIILMACASLTKGPVGSVFPCLVIGIYQLMRGRAFGRTFLSLFAIGLLSLIPLTLWFVAAYYQGGQAFSDLMMEENTGRLLGKMSYESHNNSVWYNFLTLVWGWIPWVLVLLIASFYLKWNGFHNSLKKATSIQQLKNAWFKFRNLPPIQLFTWLVIIIIFIFYCIPKSKRSVYLLPIYPFMAVLIAEYLLALAQRGVKFFKFSAIFFMSLCILFTVIFVIVRCGLLPDSIWGAGRHAAENIAYMHALQEIKLSFSKWILIFLPLIAAACIFFALRNHANARTLLYGLGGCFLSLFIVMDGVYQPTVLAVKSDKHLADQVRGYVSDGVIYSYSKMSFYCTNFYLNDRMRHFEKLLPAGEGYVLLPENLNDEFLNRFRRDYKLKEVFLTEKRSCDLRTRIYMYKFNANSCTPKDVQ